MLKPWWFTIKQKETTANEESVAIDFKERKQLEE